MIARIRPFTNRVINPITRRFAGHLPGFAILIYTGRRSGTRYRTPINVFHRDERFVFALTYGREVQNGSRTCWPRVRARSKSAAGPSVSSSPR